MPTHVRILLALAAAEAANALHESDEFDELHAADGFAAEDPHSTHVYDVYDKNEKRISTAETVRQALRSLPPPVSPEEQALHRLMVRELQTESLSGREPVACADVTLPKLGVCMQAVSARGAVQEGVASFCVGDKLLSSMVRAVRVVVSSGGTQLTLVALVHGAGFAGSRPAFHYMGSPAGKLVDLRALQVGKKSLAASSGASHYLRRAGQLEAHTTAMQNVGVAVDVPQTKRAHTPLLDAYVSHAEHEGRALMCVSVFA